MAPDLILDVGTVDAGYAALADRVQRDTGIPYLLLDGGLRQTPGLLRIVGDLLGVPERGVALAAWAERALAETGGRTATLGADQRRRAYFGRGADGLDTGGATSSMSRAWRWRAWSTSPRSWSPAGTR